VSDQFIFPENSPEYNVKQDSSNRLALVLLSKRSGKMEEGKWMMEPALPKLPNLSKRLCFELA